MKIILTGATGYIGHEVLDQCIKHNFISHIYVLTRRTLDAKYATHKKVTQVIHEGFNEWPDYLLQKLKGYGVQGCIWCLGPSMKVVKDIDDARRVGVHYPIVAAEALAKYVAPEMMETQTGRNIQPFRFVFISGAGATQNPFASLWVRADTRKIKGAAEKGLLDIAEQSEEVDGKKCFKVFALRASDVIPGGRAMSTIMYMGTGQYIAVDILARISIKIVLDGHEKTILENTDCLGDDWADVNSLAF